MLIGTFILTLGLIATGATRSQLVLASAGLVVLLGLIYSMIRDRRQGISYTLHEDRMLLRRGADVEELALEQLEDVNLLGTEDARHYLQQIGAGTLGPQHITSSGTRRSITRFCTAKVGLNGFDRWFSGQLHPIPVRERDELVLLRAKDGRQRLLSPKHGNDLVAAINRAMDVLHTSADTSDRGREVVLADPH